MTSEDKTSVKAPVTKKEEIELPIINPERHKELVSQFEVYTPQSPGAKGNVPYKFFGRFSFDKDAEDRMGTGTLEMPYDPQLWAFWEPGFAELWIYGGTYDYSLLFHGRTREIKQDGELIEISLQDDGWRLKQQCFISGINSGKVAEAFEILVDAAGMNPVIVGLKKDYQIITEDNATGTISGSATEGETGTYTPESTGTPGFISGNVNQNPFQTANPHGKTPQTMCPGKPPTTTECISGPSWYPVNQCSGAPWASYSFSWLNYCPACGRSGSLRLEGKPTYGGIYCSGCDVDYDPVGGFGTAGIGAGGVEVGNAPPGSVPAACSIRLTPCGSSPGGSEGGDEGEKTYEDTIKEICEGHDLIFYTDFNNNCILYDYPSLIEEIGKKCFQIENWMVKYPTFSLDVNQFGYYTVVEVKYKNGTVREKYEDLVAVFGEKVKKIDAPDLNKIQAQTKAKTVLATLLRDFGMEVRAEVLHSGALLPGTFCSIENPITKNREIYFINGINVSQSPDGPMMCSLTLLYAPKNPEVSAIPEIAGAKATGYNNQTLDAIGYEEAKFGSVQEVCSNARCYEELGKGDCWADSEWLYNHLNAAGIPARIIGNRGGRWPKHAWVEINLGNGWETYPYAKYGSKHVGIPSGVGTPFVLIPEGGTNANILATGYGR